MQEIEKIRTLICEQIEVNDCPACNDPTYIACQEHKRHHGILGEVLTSLNQLEEKLNKEIEVERVIIAMYVSNGYDAWHRESDAYKEKLRTESKAAIAEINRQRNEQ